MVQSHQEKSLNKLHASKRFIDEVKSNNSLDMSVDDQNHLMIH